jgi:hypothetical protein
MFSSTHYKDKYLKYKAKYLKFKLIQFGGGYLTAKKYFYSRIYTDYTAVKSILTNDTFFQSTYKYTLPNTYSEKEVDNGLNITSLSIKTIEMMFFPIFSEIFNTIYSIAGKNTKDQNDNIEIVIKIYFDKTLGSSNSLENVGRLIDCIDKIKLLKTSSKHLIKMIKSTDENDKKGPDKTLVPELIKNIILVIPMQISETSTIGIENPNPNPKTNIERAEELLKSLNDSVYTSLEQYENIVDNNFLQLFLTYIDNKKKSKISASDRQKIIKEKGEDDVEIVFSTVNVFVYMPKTKEGAIYYGRNTKWCTAAQNNNMFDYYNKKGSIYIIQSKHDPLIKYQLHNEANEFKDNKDKEVTIEDVYNQFSDNQLRDFLYKLKKDSIIKQIEKTEKIFRGEYDEGVSMDELGIDFDEDIEIDITDNYMLQYIKENKDTIHINNYKYICNDFNFILDLQNLTVLNYNFKNNNLITNIDLSPLTNIQIINKNFLLNCNLITSIELSPLINLLRISDNFMSNCNLITSIDLSPLVKLSHINNNFMSDCNNLTDIILYNLPELSNIGNRFISNCKNLTNITLFNLPKLKLISNNFIGFDKYKAKPQNLTSITLSNLPNLESLGDDFMINCITLKNIILSNLPKLKKIHNNFMLNCNSLKKISLSDLPEVETLCDNFMSGCSSLISIDITNLPKLKSVGKNFLNGCRLTSHTLVVLFLIKNTENIIFGDKFLGDKQMTGTVANLYKLNKSTTSDNNWKKYNSTYTLQQR